MTYKAEIEIGVKGAKELQGLTDRIKNASNAVQGLNDFVENLSGSVPKTFNNIASAVQEATRVFDESVSGTREATQAAYALTRAEAAYNAELKERNELLSRVRASQGPSIRGQRLTETQQQGQESFQQFFADAQEQAKGISINATNIRTAWSTFFSDAEQLALDLQTSTSAKQAQIKRNWAVFFGDAAEVASDLQNTANARNAQIKLSWNKFFGDAAEVASDLQTATTARAGTVKQSWTRFFADAAEVASELQTTAKTRASQLNRNWSTFFADAAKVAQDLQASSSAKKLNVKTSWVKFFSDAEELANELRATAATKEAKIKLSWGKFFNEADTVARDLRLAAKTDRVRIERSWAKFFDDAEQLALDLGKKARDTRAKRAVRTKDAISSGIIGGAFPLLFGQGAGASVGGAVGGVAGGLVGGQFGFGLSLVGTQLGTIFDNLVTKAGNLANSLNTTGEILSGLEEAGFKVSDATKGVIASYEEAGLLSDAYALALGEVNRVLGPDGVEKLDAYKTETKRLNAEFEKISGALQSELIPALTGLLRIILGTKAAFDTFANSPLGQLFLKGAKELVFNAPGGGGLRGASFAIGALQAVGAPTGPAEKPEAQRLAEEKLAMGILDAEQKRNKAAREQRYLLDAQIDLAKLGNNLLDEAVVKAKEKVIQETYLADMRKKDLTVQEKLLADDKRRLALAQLNRSIKDAEAAAAAKTSKGAKDILRLNRAIGSEKLKQDKLERSIQLVGKDKLTKVRAELKSLNDREVLERAFIISSTEDVKLQDEKLKTLALQFDLKEAQLKQTEKELIAQREISALKAEQEVSGLRRNLQQELEGLALPTGDRIDDAFINLQRQQEARSANKINAINEAIALQEKLNATGLISNEVAEKEIQKLRDKKAVYEELLPQISEAEKRQLVYNETLAAVQGPINSLVFGLRDVIGGTKTAQEAFADFLNVIADQFFTIAARMIATYVAIGVARTFAGVPASSGTGSAVNTIQDGSAFNLPGNIISLGGPDFAANGGPVKSGSPYIIGERGPELFVPRSNGRVVPNGRFDGGSGGDVSVVVNVDAKGSSAEGNQPNAKALGAAIGAAVQSEIIKQKRPGGLLA